MKRLSDYKDEEAIDLWADLLEYMSAILADKKMIELIKSKKSKLMIARGILKSHKNEAAKILLRIDDTPLNGLNILTRLVNLLIEIDESEEFGSFFGLPEQKKSAESFGSATENTEADAE